MSCSGSVLSYPVLFSFLIGSCSLDDFLSFPPYSLFLQDPQPGKSPEGPRGATERVKILRKEGEKKPENWLKGKRKGKRKKEKRSPDRHYHWLSLSIPTLNCPDEKPTAIGSITDSLVVSLHFWSVASLV